MSLKKGLVLDLDISSEGLQGTTKFKDKTPYENNGTLSNVTLTTDHKGKANSAGLFNGTDSYIDCGNNSSLDITGAITMSAWIKASDTTSFQTLFGKGLSFNSNGNNGYSLGIYNTRIYFDTHDSVQRNSLQSLSGTVKQNEWFFLTATWDGTTTTNGKKIYINGVLNNEETSTISEIAGTNLFNFLITKGSYYFNGSIERPQIWNRALSADEVKLLYESYNPCLHIDSLQKGLVGHWTMAQDSLKGSLLADKTPYENDGTIYGATFTTDRKGKANSAMSFDGNDDYVRTSSFNDLKLQNYTFSCWIKANDFNAYRGILEIADESTRRGRLMTFGGDTIRFHPSFADSSEYLEYKNLEKDVYINLVAVWNGSRAEIYKNGDYVDGKDLAININYNNPFIYIGKDNYNTRIFNGLIDDVRLYNRALSEEEIIKLYESYNK